MILIILLALVLYRRRRIQQHNLSYIDPQPNYAGGNPGGPPEGAQPGPYAAGYAPNYSRNSYGSPQPQYSQPQYPPQTLNGSGHGYEPNGGFAPVSVPVSDWSMSSIAFGQPPGPPPAHIQQQDYPRVQQQDYPPPQYFPPPNGPPPEGKM
ncbi:hypothetical protein EWM64_g10570 [Hericium alpestre]|uniref:Uncharacterized protein n=1 Tax=Hericium alpestre TaxID=135208 RepID=A0A4Y9ZFS5_9AGAM|nr:hypothetical protein EWM64_g10570 [Hericium alpestre]